LKNLSTAGTKGIPFDNHLKLYLGSLNDWDLNAKVQRFTASPTALHNMQAYQTSGKLQRPLVTIHNTADQVVPYSHELGYWWKTLGTGSSSRLTVVPVFRYGHCNFQASEILLAFAIMVLQDLGQPLNASVENVLPASQRSEFRARAAQMNAIRH
jgi:hypothetical protein